MGTTTKILIVESDISGAEILWNEVREAGYEPLSAFSVKRAMMLIEQAHPRAILLRWKLPDASGHSLVADLRMHAATSRLPVIVLGEEGASEEECIRALEAGADDYVKRPYGIREVLARIKVVLRPIEYREARGRVSVGTLTMDFDARRAFARIGQDQREVELQLQPTCYRLLRFFVENPYKVLSRKDIIDHVWFVASIKEGTVDVHIASLRETLKPLKKSLAIETVRGVGFRLSAVADIPQVQPQTQQAVESIASPATPQPPKSPQSPQSPRPVERRRVPDDRPRAGGAPHQPVFASNLGAAVEKIRRLRALLQRETEENLRLRDAMEAVRQENKR